VRKLLLNDVSVYAKRHKSNVYLVNAIYINPAYMIFYDNIWFFHQFRFQWQCCFFLSNQLPLWSQKGFSNPVSTYMIT